MGTDDTTCPYDGGVGVLGHDFLPAETSAAVWAAHNKCDETPMEEPVGDHVRMEWDNCDNDRRVIHYRLNDVGHMVPPDVDGDTIATIIDFFLGLDSKVCCFHEHRRQEVLGWRQSQCDTH